MDEEPWKGPMWLGDAARLIASVKVAALRREITQDVNASVERSQAEGLIREAALMRTGGSVAVSLKETARRISPAVVPGPAVQVSAAADAKQQPSAEDFKVKWYSIEDDLTGPSANRPLAIEDSIRSSIADSLCAREHLVDPDTG